MPRRPAPWFKTSHGAWYVKIRGRTIRLGEDEAAAWKEFHKLMAADGPAPVVPPSRLRLDAMIDAWLASKTEVKPLTLKLCGQFAQSFIDSTPTTTRAADVRAAHVTAWLALHPNWSKTTRSIAVRTVKAAFRWAALEERIPRNPLATLKTPKPEVREPADVATVELVLSEVSDLAKRIFMFMYFTGARPGEAVGVEAKGIDAARGVVRVAGKMGDRYVVVPSHYMPTLLDLAKENPKGALFRNSRNQPWTIDAVQSQLRRARKRLGVTGKFVPYHLRGIFASGRIAAGVGDSLVGKMLGHTNPYTLHKHYHNPDLSTLREAVDREMPGERKKKPRR